MKKHKIGIIGYGGFGKFVHHWWNKLENVEVIAVADAKLDDSDLGDCKVYKNGLDLLNNPEVEIVSIVTPPALHAGMACAAMRAGKHVLLEKPVAISLEQCEQIFQVQQETGMIITVDHMLRYNPIIKALGMLSRNMTFGNLRHSVVSNYAQDSSLPDTHWFWDRELSGGILVEHGVHFFDIINSLTVQNVEKVNGVYHDRNDKQRDQVSATVLYDGGLIASHYHSFSGPGFFEKTTIRLTYDLAKIEIEGWVPMRGTIQALVASGSTELENLPFWKQESSQDLRSIEDTSRPEGWGDTSESGIEVTGGGIPYDVGMMVTGSFNLQATKGDVYGKCLQDIMSDLIAKIEDNNHTLRITLEDAIKSVKIALEASK